MDMIVFLPAIFVFLALIITPPEKVFQNYYMPILLMLPQNFSFHMNRVPDLTFSQATIIPLFFFSIVSRFDRWKWSLSDLIISILFCEMVYSEYDAEGIGSSAQVFTNGLTNMVFPYILAKILIHRGGYTISFAKTITLIMYVNILLSFYEQRFMVNPYIQFFQRFFPTQGHDWPTIDRYGFVRIAGPFATPILFAVACSIAFFLNYWLVRNRYWSPHYRFIPDIPINKGWIFSAVLMFGLVFTFSRGPLLSLFLGFLFVGVGTSRYPWHSFMIRGGIFIFVGVILLQIYEAYSSVGIALATSDQDMTLSYRTGLIDKYDEIVWEKPWLGWGVNSWPKVANTVSIDNQYLWLTLKHGFIATSIYILLIIYIVIRLMRRGLSLPLNYKRERTLDFTFLGSFLAIVFAFVTVFMGMQLEALFFIMVGWIEGYVLTRPQNDEIWDKATDVPQQYLKRY